MKQQIIIGLFVMCLMTATKSQDIPAHIISIYQINPAGIDDKPSIMTSYTRWDGSATNSPQQFFAMGSSSFKNTYTFGGIQASSTSVGSLTYLQAEGTYAFRFKATENSKIHLGLSGTINQLGINMGKIHPDDPSDPVLNNAESGNWFDANTGIMFHYLSPDGAIRKKEFIAGVSANNLFQQSTSLLVSDFSTKSFREYVGVLRYTLGLTKGNSESKFAPKIQLTTIIATYTENLVYDVTSRLIFSKTFGVGIGYMSTGMGKGELTIEMPNISFGYVGAWDMAKKYTGAYTMNMHSVFVRLTLNPSNSSR